MSDAGLERAQAAAAAARAQLLATAQEIQSRLEPNNLLDEAVANVRDHSARIARTAGETVRERPALFGAAAAAGGLLLVRRPLLRLGRRLFGRGRKRKHETEDDAAG